MEFGRESGNVVQVITGGNGGGGVDNWMAAANDQALWATEDDYRVWNGDGMMDNSSNLNYDGEPANKKSRSLQSADSQGSGVPSNNRSKAIGKMFFKTKLCCKFRAGTCPYVTNCNFAHSIEELRRPPPNWQDIVAAHEEEKRSSEPREEFRIPSIDSSNFSGESSRSYKGRHCKKFYTEEGCPYGENCTFLHDEHSRSRESVAISLNPGPGSSYGPSVSPSGTTVKPSNWKTRICNKWEMTGYCPFGSKCHFAHGIDELHRYGGGPVEIDLKDSATAPPDSKQSGVPSKTSGDVVVASVPSVPHSDLYHSVVPSQRPSNAIQRLSQRALQKWKGPDKISKIYGDWIDDIE